VFKAVSADVYSWFSFEEQRVPSDDVESAEFAAEQKCQPGRLVDAHRLRNWIVEPVWVWGVPFAPFSMAAALSAIGRLIEAGRPTYFITANVHYAMLTGENADLRSINEQAAFILADGAPLVWASRWLGSPLPERVAGSDLIFEFSALAAQKGHRLFFLGGAEGVAANAVERLCELCPGLQIVGVESPPFRDQSDEEHEALAARIRAARPDMLFTAFTMPRGERWLAANYESLGVPVLANIGAAIDFAAGRVRRAPRWMQKCGLEWAFRLWLEPRRLFGRYFRNACFIVRMVAQDLLRAARGRAAHR
jgi:N-acetylglucosaminyldiphosphoundecaprenol N-acetyl-beta-D-mannosaminyltransferase